MAALSIITVKFVAIGLTKELAGNYNSAYGFLQLFGILADFGLYAVAVREVSKAKDKSKVLGALIVLRSIILVLSLSAALLFVWILPKWQGTPLPLSVTIAALVPFFTLLAGMIRTVFQIEYKMQYVFAAEVLQRIFTVTMIALLVLLGTKGSNDLHVLHLFLFFGGVGAFILFLLSFFFANKLMRIRPDFDPDLLKSLFKKAAPYGVAFLFMALYRQFDVTMIAMLRPDFEIQNAYYGFVLRMTEVGFLLPTFLLNSTLPMLSERDSKGEDTRSMLGKTLVIILLIGTTAMLFSVLWSRPLIQLLTTESYLSTATRAGSDTALRLMSLPMFLNGLVLMSFYTLLTKHEWKRLVISLGIASAISIGCNMVLIPEYGFIGANYTSILVHLILVGILLPQSLKIMPVRIPMRSLQVWGMYTVLLAAGLWLLVPLLDNEIATVIGLLIMMCWIGVIVLLARIHKVLL